jgi:exonuclease III
MMPTPCSTIADSEKPNSHWPSRTHTGEGRVRLLSWNVAGRVRAVAAQADALAEQRIDVVVLQEVRATAVTAWHSALRTLGFSSVLAALAPGPAAPDPSRRLGVLIAARAPLSALSSPALPWPERHLAALAHMPTGPVAIHAVHVPTSNKADAVKIRTLQTLRAALAASPTGYPCVVAGDLNTPQYESREGEVRSFARTRSGHLRPTHGERHDRAELGFVPGLADLGFVDAFRDVHGYGARDRSWMYPNGKMGYRLDHLFARGLRPVRADYVHAWRERRLSDHSALLVELVAPSGQAVP